MAAVRKTIRLSAEQAAWIAQQTVDGAFDSDDEDIFHLIDRDREDRHRRLQVAIAEGLESGISEKSLPEIWDRAENRACTSNA